MQYQKMNRNLSLRSDREVRAPPVWVEWTSNYYLVKDRQGCGIVWELLGWGSGGYQCKCKGTRSQQQNSSNMLIPIVFVIIGVFIGVSQSAGTGGGPILNMCIMMGIDSDPKVAMALTYIFLMGGSFASLLQNLTRRTRNGELLVDYGLIELTLPMMLAGSLFGLMLNHYMSDMLITVFFTVLLIYLCNVSYTKYKESLGQKNEEEITNDLPTMLTEPLTTPPKECEAVEDSVSTDAENDRVDKPSIPVSKLKNIGTFMALTIAFLLVRGSPHFESMIGISPCGGVYWVFNFVYLGAALLFAKKSAYEQFLVQEERAKFEFCDSSADQLTLEKFKKYMFFGFLAGTAGGALGLGGSSILIPMWLNCRIDKDVATGSSPPLIFLSSFISFFLSALSGRYTLLEFLQYFALSFLSSFFIKRVISYVADKLDLKSLVYFLLLFTSALSLIVLLPFQYFNYLEDPKAFVHTGRFC